MKQKSTGGIAQVDKTRILFEDMFFEFEVVFGKK